MYRADYESYVKTVCVYKCIYAMPNIVVYKDSYSKVTSVLDTNELIIAIQSALYIFKYNVIEQ